MATSAIPERRWPPPEDLIAHDPQNIRFPDYEVCCLACGSVADLVRRRDVFLCRDQFACQMRVRACDDNPEGGPR